ncbi:hypothetical protein AAFF_G00120520 [Aldrovandia affinis]|uniref:Uncharacterized protein n=1 Tax=Aldrovandia affinis TaxID=143900 RepID=A0AAD7RS11_9TELE|nr:hypothetical protein AAFF_G00120520 [Aldrovandia affinis]
MRHIVWTELLVGSQTPAGEREGVRACGRGRLRVKVKAHRGKDRAPVMKRNVRTEGTDSKTQPHQMATGSTGTRLR